mgnify:CR=1 FL=1
MKIGSKIALFYTLISVLTTVIIIAVFYIFSTQYINKLYASYLREKAYLTAQKHWEKDEVDEQSYQIIQRKYDELLPEAHEILLNMDSLSEVRDTLNKYLTQHQQTLLLAGTVFLFLLNIRTSWEPPFIIRIMKGISSYLSCPGMPTEQKSRNICCYFPFSSF